MDTNYDNIAVEYSNNKKDEWRVSVEKHTILNVCGDLKNLDVLDLACGSGTYTRIFKQLGCKSALGIDISEEMIKIAKKEQKGDESIDSYIRKDVKDLEKIREFDIVFAIYLLNYAKNEEDLEIMLKNIYKNMKNGAKLIIFNDNVFSKSKSDYSKYGFTKNYIKDNVVLYKLFPNMDIINYYTHYEILINTLNRIGFSNIKRHRLKLDSTVEDKSYWDTFLSDPPVMCLTAEK